VRTWVICVGHGRARELVVVHIEGTSVRVEVEIVGLRIAAPKESTEKTMKKNKRLSDPIMKIKS
jgi:hypothetical protein